MTVELDGRYASNSGLVFLVHVEVTWALLNNYLLTLMSTAEFHQSFPKGACSQRNCRVIIRGERWRQAHLRGDGSSLLTDSGKTVSFGSISGLESQQILESYILGSMPISGEDLPIEARTRVASTTAEFHRMKELTSAHGTIIFRAEPERTCSGSDAFLSKCLSACPDPRKGTMEPQQYWKI